ncbi:MAG: hypothetical protein JWQ35_2434 [Bacteriovoracaceae bacterium]|nr:hypothetical protein [Bacteriovoracaceae bacterium]
MFWSSLVISGFMIVGNPLPEWFSELNPSARFRLRWTERSERNAKVSGFSLLAQAGVFPDIREQLKAGLQISTNSNSPAAPPNSAPLSNGMENKELSFHQAYVEFHLGNRFKWSALVGKFIAPTFSSPLIWDEEIAPEGLFQSLEFSSGSHFRLATYAAQYAVDQALASVSAGTPLRRSWLFQEGIFGFIDWSSEGDLKFAVNHYYFYDLSENIANRSSSLGNTTLSLSNNNSSFRYAYAPLEAVLAATASPLGIQTGIKGAFCVNFRTPDQQRGFYLETHLGNAWKAKNFLFTLSYYYNEPDVTVSFFTDNAYGYTNRKGPRAEISYFVSRMLRLGVSALYAETLASSNYQSNRKEIRSDLEFEF